MGEPPSPRASGAGVVLHQRPQGGLLLGGEPAQVGEVGVLAGPPLHQRQDLQHPVVHRAGEPGPLLEGGLEPLGAARASARRHSADAIAPTAAAAMISRKMLAVVLNEGLGRTRSSKAVMLSAASSPCHHPRPMDTARTAPITHSDGRLGPPLLHISSPWVRKVIRKKPTATATSRTKNHTGRSRRSS